MVLKLCMLLHDSISKLRCIGFKSQNIQRKNDQKLKVKLQKTLNYIIYVHKVEDICIVGIYKKYN